MFGTKQRRTNRRPSNVRSRDGYTRRTSAERRKVKKASGLTGKQVRKVTKKNRRYRKGL